MDQEMSEEYMEAQKRSYHRYALIVYGIGLLICAAIIITLAGYNNALTESTLITLGIYCGGYIVIALLSYFIFLRWDK